MLLKTENKLQVKVEKILNKHIRKFESRIKIDKAYFRLKKGCSNT